MSAMESSVRGLHSEQPTCRRRDRLRAGFQSLSRTFSSRNRRGAENYQQDGVSHPQTSLAGVETPSADFMSRPGSSLPWPEHGEDIAEEDEEEDNNTHSTLFRRMSRSITGWIDPRLHAPGNRDESEPDPQSHSRRLSRTVSNWLDPRLHTPGNRDDSLNERDGPYDLPVPLPLPNLSMHFDGPLSDNEGSEEPIASDLPNRSRPLSVDNGASETRRSRRATWGPVPMTGKSIHPTYPEMIYCFLILRRVSYGKS
ncbi:hypothetical protein EJ08DRAFT_643284 [Tothia fuscella]|uniref:Uncharacterized protein n=1 Tax=Tothia fuscella TaxID=1048955 RepID=A0A9P4NES1_9PEZI|nr:hypothetical protein EJ08DRAFT_643284 [Tothia fuscella]